VGEQRRDASSILEADLLANPSSSGMVAAASTNFNMWCAMLTLVGFGCGGNRELCSISASVSRVESSSRFPPFFRLSSCRWSHVPRVPSQQEAVAAHSSLCLVGGWPGHWKFDRASSLSRFCLQSHDLIPLSFFSSSTRSGPSPSSTVAPLRMILYLQDPEGPFACLGRSAKTRLGGSSSSIISSSHPLSSTLTCRTLSSLQVVNVNYGGHGYLLLRRSIRSYASRRISSAFSLPLVSWPPFSRFSC